MQICNEQLPEICRYIEYAEQASDHSIDAYDAPFNRYLRYIVQGLNRLDDHTNILEVGVGTGWFPIMCRMRGLRCRGIDISPQLVDYARRWGRNLGAEPDVELGNIESCVLGECVYDAVIAADVFEHVENWKDGIGRVYGALKPGGVLYFESTNKFGFGVGEYGFPLYGWLPDKLRYEMRVLFDDPRIMQLGIDFNQFRHSQLRHEFKKVGFSRVMDRIDMAQDDMISSNFRKAVVRWGRKSPYLKNVLLTFCDATRFLCIK